MRAKSAAVLGCLVLSMAFLVGVGTSDSSAVRALTGHEGSVRDAISFIQAGDTKRALAVLDALHGAVVEARALLNGWAFRGERQMLTDPFLLPAGAYRVRLTTEGLGYVKIHSVQGTGYVRLFSLSVGRASGGATALYRSTGERVMVEFDLVTAPYQLVFERVQ